MTTSLVRPLLLMSLTCAPALAQAYAVNGVVLGFDGEPARGAVLEPLSKVGNAPLAGVLSRDDGSFDVVAPRVAATLRVQLEGVTRELPLTGRERDLRISFADAAHFTLRGHVVTPDGRPATGVDLAFRRAPDDTIVTTTTDARGAFRVRLGEPASDVLVDPLGWRHAVDGPFARDRGLAVDLRLERDAYRCVHGRVLDENGAPVPFARVEALDAELARTGLRTRADGDGVYRLWSPRVVEAVRALDGVPLALRTGPWAADQEVALDARSHGYVLFVGRVVDADGEGVEGAAVFTLPAQGPPPRRAEPRTTSGRDGWFRVRTPMTRPFVWVRAADGRSGAGRTPDAGAVLRLVVE